MSLAFGKTPQDKLILASAGRDRLLHIFNASTNFDLMQTLEEHTSTITSILFTKLTCKLISSGSDKSCVFRSLKLNEDEEYFVSYRTTPLKSTVYSMVTETSENFIVTANQDRKLTFLEIETGKINRTHSPTNDSADSSTPTSFVSTLDTDPSGLFIAAGSSDKSLRIIDFHTVSLGLKYRETLFVRNSGMAI